MAWRETPANTRSFTFLAARLGCLICFAVSTTAASELKPETLAAWRAYIQAAEAKLMAHIEKGGPFLSADQAGDRAALLRAGELLVEPRETRSVPHGLIHDWFGSVFIPNVTLDHVGDVLHDFDRYKDFFGPVVVDSHNLGRAGESEAFSMRWVHKVLFVTVVLDNQYQSKSIRLNDRRSYGISFTTSVQEVENYGSHDEYRLAPDKGTGYIWRMYSITKCEQRDGGVYIDLEAIALTRDIPISLRWLVKPVVQQMSRNAILTSLKQTRDAVLHTSVIAKRTPTPPGLMRAPLSIGIPRASGH